jgi:hypothetical protein
MQNVIFWLEYRPALDGHSSGWKMALHLLDDAVSPLFSYYPELRLLRSGWQFAWFVGSMLYLNTTLCTVARLSQSALVFSRSLLCTL